MIERIREYSMCGALAVLMLVGMGAQAARADLAADINSALGAGTHPQAVQAVGKVASDNPNDADKIADLVTSIITESDAPDYAAEVARACAKASNVSECTKKVVTQFVRSFPASSDKIVSAVVAAGRTPEIVAAALQSITPAAGQPLGPPGPFAVIISPGVGVNAPQGPAPKGPNSTRLLQVFGLQPTTETKTSPDQPTFED